MASPIADVCPAVTLMEMAELSIITLGDSAAHHWMMVDDIAMRGQEV